MSLVEREMHEARGYILVAIAQGSGESASSTLLQFGLDTIGIRYDLAWVATQMEWLAEERLISISHAAGVVTGELLERGRDVLEKRVKVDGLLLPRRVS
ncbi:MAG: hypothetical protein AAGP08_00140 [Pseudomonadota bacterium]